MQLDFGINAGLVEELYAQFLENPDAVDATWRDYFEARLAETPARAAIVKRAQGRPLTDGDLARTLGDALDRTLSAAAAQRGSEVTAEAAVQARVYQLINAYRVRGHLFANLDPLGAPPALTGELDLVNFGLAPDDLDKPFPTVDLAGGSATQTLRDIVERLEETYCRSIGVEYTHIEEREQRTWLQRRMESTKNRLELSHAEQLRILTKLSDAEIFEQFLQRAYELGTKRFSLEGAESLIPLLDLLIERAAEQDVAEIVMGMAHRGRLNVLANTLGKSVREIFAAFEDKDAQHYLGSGDVKYHLGYSNDLVTESGKHIHLTLTFNPSHLEFVNPVAEGRTRAKQERRGGARKDVMPLLIHGDAAFIGQGVNAETLNLSGLAGYETGGTIHVLVNNQIGFTTDPKESRTTRYATDLVRMLRVPVFHVNGEDPEAVAQVALLAIDWRQRFGRDVIIDMYCYRRYGHNEGDEPRYTQPRMYAAIDEKPTVRQVYVRRLVEMGHVTNDKAEEIVVRRREALTTDLDEVKQKGFAPVTYSMGGVWAHYRGGLDTATPEVDTTVPADKLLDLSRRLLELPAGFKAHPKVVPILRARHDKLVAGEAFEWGTGEMLAYASLLSEKTPVRLSGQDSQRGTFSHRHSVLHDTETGAPYAPLSSVASAPARFEVYNSPLSETGVLGFDFGYSLDYPDALVIWEAQFGDFLNSAQVIVDQFITSSEDKWRKLSGLVLYLPHGYEGQGPEQSSARPRAVPAEQRGGQHPGLQPDHAGAALPRAPPPGAAAVAQAARHLHAEEPAPRRREPRAGRTAPSPRSPI